MSKRTQEDLKDKTMDGHRYIIPDLNLKSLNLSDNQFECFPWVAIHQMTHLKEIYLRGNKIKKLLDEQEKRNAQNMQQEYNFSKSYFECFSKNLKVLDLSSNQLREFPKELNVLNLTELNRIHNQIQTIPTSFWMS